jgi:hypothetical protein
MGAGYFKIGTLWYWWKRAHLIFTLQDWRKNGRDSWWLQRFKKLLGKSHISKRFIAAKIFVWKELKGLWMPQKWRWDIVWTSNSRYMD